MTETNSVLTAEASSYKIGCVQNLDGPLFKATVMEDKWDIYFHEGYLLFARSWTGSLIYKCTTVRGLDSLANY